MADETSMGKASLEIQCGNCGNDFTVTVDIPTLPEVGEEEVIPVAKPVCPTCGTQMQDELDIRITGDATEG
jgi:ribosomal protein S27AE